jgi:hypothetical protein
MKKILLLATLALGFKANAQSCSNYYFLQNNKTIEMAMFSKNDKPAGKLVYNVTNVQKSGGMLSSTINEEMFNDNGKSLSKGVINMKCNGGVYMMDLKSFIPQQQAAQLKDIDAKSEFYLEYPAGIKVGDVLKDGSFTMNMNNGMSAEMEITNRKVEAEEEVTTPAGTWKCMKITYHSKVKTKIGGIGIPFNMDQTEWYAPGFGVVRSTSNKNTRVEIVSIK